MSPSTDSRENREFAEEMKFVVSPEVGQQIRQWARTYLAPDPNATGTEGDEYRITSLYFDTAAFDVFRRRGSYGRSKFRIRRYGASDQVFLERKLKTHRLVTKRRTLVPTEQLVKLTDGGVATAWRGFWYFRRLQLRQLKPVCQIAYNRTARVTMTSTGPIRLTIDQDLQAVPINTIEFSDGAPTRISPQHFIIEMKFRGQLPSLFKSVVQEFALTPTAISKYRLSVVDLRLAPSEILDSVAARAKTPVYA